MGIEESFFQFILPNEQMYIDSYLRMYNVLAKDTKFDTVATLCKDVAM